ncbi:MAG: hypothetical protein AAF329_19670 [Cyanobacteria bacterium P01_A01_bin.17]
MADERERQSAHMMSDAAKPNREPVSIILTGSSWGIRLMIYTLFKCGFAEVDAWSKLQQMPSSDRMMSVMTKYINPAEKPQDSDSHDG